MTKVSKMPISFHLFLATPLIGREPEGSVGTKLVNKAHGDFWEGIHP